MTNSDQFNLHFIRYMVMALVVHVYHDWGVAGQIGILLFCFTGAIFYCRYVEKAQ